MAKVKFKNGRVEDYTIVLSTRDKRHLGQLYGLKSITYSGHMNSANEMSFSIYKNDLLKTNDIVFNKQIKKHREYLWDNIVDFKLIWVKELNEYFEIHVSLDDSNDVYKSITATSLCEAELSQVMLYNVEINTLESDVQNEDYRITTFYNDEDTKASLLHRVLECVPHYKIAHVDKSLCDIQRTFSIDGTSVYDFLTGECAEQFDCLFKFNSSERSISVYDLLTVCKECGERGDFQDKCPECGSKKLKYYGKDTTIYVDKNNLTDAIQLSTNVDSIKNCFKLEAGDDTITLAARTLNQNGSDRIYINYASDLNKKCNDCGECSEFEDKCSICGSTNWEYTNERIKDMPKELVKKLIEYNDLYNSYTEEYEELTLRLYNLTDKIAYYTSSMMPKVEHISNVDYETEADLAYIEDPKEGYIYIWNDIIYLYNGEKFVPQYGDDALFYKSLIEEFVDAETEAKKLTEVNLSPIGLRSVTSSTSLSTVNSAIKNYAKIYVRTGYVKLEIEEGSIEEDENGKTKVLTDDKGWHYGTWKGKIKVTNYSDEEDVATTSELTIKFYDNYQEFNTQKIEKNLKSNDDKENSVFDVLSIDELEDFKKAIKLYSHNRLDSFYDALNEALTLLQEMEQSEEGADLYDLYLSYQAKLYAIRRYAEEDELGEDDIRQAQIAELETERDEVNNRMIEIQSILNFEEYIGDLYPIFCAYKREDKYSNSNYISDGLNNAGIIDKANEFIEVAKKELIKSSEQQYTLSATLYNLLVMKEFKELVNNFELGNWIRVRVDGVLYRLRLISYIINFDSLQTIDVEFSTLTKVKDIMSDVESILSSAQSMATSYGSVSKQSEQGQEANDSLNSIVQNGLNSALVQIKNNDNEEVTYGKHGILLRQHDDIMDDYDDKQCRLTHNAMLYTTDGWKTASLAIGEHNYRRYNEDIKDFEATMDYGVTSKFVQAGYIYGTQIVAGNIYSDNYNESKRQGSHFNLRDGSLQLGANFDWDGTKLYITGACIGSKDYVHKWEIGNDTNKAYIYNGTSSMDSVTAGTYLGTDGFRNYKSSNEYVNISNGVLDCVGAKIKGAITGGTISIGSNFSVDEYGNVIATNATLKGDINASNANITGNIYANYLEANTGGKIGGWTIGASTLTGGNVTLNSNGDITGSGWSITNGGKATFNTLYANSSGQIAGWTISSNSISKGSTVLSANKSNGSVKIVDSSNGAYWMNMGVISNHLASSGLNVGDGGISFRPGSTSSSIANEQGHIGYNNNYIYCKPNGSIGFMVSHYNGNPNSATDRIEYSPSGVITLRSNGALYLRNSTDTGSGGLHIYSNQETAYKIGRTGIVVLGDAFCLFVNGILVGVGDAADSVSWKDKGYNYLG